MRHRHEVVLTTNTAHDPPIRQTVRNRSPGQGHHHGGIDETRMLSLLDSQGHVIAVELIDETDTRHVELATLALGQLAQRCVEALRSEKETAVQQYAVAQANAES